MMNLIALGLIATSFVASGIFSPNPVSNGRGGGGEQVIVKDGHRAVVVEYADVAGDGNTKVSISPPRKPADPPPDELSRAAAAVAGVSQHGAGPRELICDAYGRCKHKVAGVLGRAREKAAEAEEDTVDAVKGVVGGVKGKAKDTVEVLGDVKDKVKKTGEKVRETAAEVEEQTVDAVKGMVKETGEKVGGVKDKVKETGEKVIEKTEEVIEKGRKGKKKVWDMVKDVFNFDVDSIGNLMNLLGVGMAYGMGVWVSFVMSYVLAGVLPRQQFGVVQSRLYPIYFKAMVGSVGLGLVGHLMAHRSKVFKSKPEILQAYNLTSSLLMLLGNLLFLEPSATKVMFERMKLEKEEGRGIDGRGTTPTRLVNTVVTDEVPSATTTTTTTAHTSVAAPAARAGLEQEGAKGKLGELENRLRKLNSYSSLLNVMTLMGLTWHLVYLSHRLGVVTTLEK